MDDIRPFLDHHKVIFVSIKLSWSNRKADSMRDKPTGQSSSADDSH